MITAEIYTQGDGKVVGFTLNGHNDVGKCGRGYNIHCAKVSALSQAACLTIGRYMNRDVIVKNEHGGLGLELKTMSDDLTEAVFQTMLIGLRAVEKDAPDAIKIQILAMDTDSKVALQRKIAAMKPLSLEPLPTLNVSNVRIRVEIYRNAKGNVAGFSVNEVKGKIVNEFEIYHNSVWALVKATFSCVKDYLKYDFESKRNSRRFSMMLKSVPNDITEVVFQTMLIGLREIQKLAPQIIKVKEQILGGETQ